jgi:integrase
MIEEETAAGKPEKSEKHKARRPGGKTKRGPDKWLLRIFRGYDAAGKRIYYSEVFHGGSKEADDRLSELRNRQKAGEPLRFAPKLFKDFVAEWLEDCDDGELREATIDHYGRMVATYILPAFGKFTLTDITDVAIKRLYKDLRKRGLAASTISQIHVYLTAIFNLAEERELIRKNPMRKVDAPAKPKPKPVAMKGDEARRFLEAAGATPHSFMFTLAFHLGARPCEYLGLKWSDVDWEQRRITIRRSLKLRKGGEWYTTAPKTEKGLRSIAVTQAIIESLAEHRRRQLEAKLKAGASWSDHGFIFTDKTGEPLKHYAVRYVYKTILEAAGLPKTFQLKVSRHSCATALINSGVNPKAVSERLGHASVKITLDTYTVIEEAMQREASEQLERAFGG